MSSFNSDDEKVVYLRFFGDYGVTINVDNWMSTEKLSCMYKTPVILTNDDNYTHAIIICASMPILNIPKKNVIGISTEPNKFLFENSEKKQSFIEYAQNNISKYYVGDKEDLPDPFVEGQTFYIYNKTHFYSNPKNKFCSIVLSDKTWTSNQVYRHKLVERILQTDLPIDIYGGGTYLYEKYNDKRVKFAFKGTPDDPHGTIPFENYKFHICIENTSSNNYFSEKISNPLLSNNVPIYYGCKKIDDYFNINIKLNGDLEHDINLLTDVYKNQENYLNNNNNKYEDIIEKLNIFNFLHVLFDNIFLRL